jgi:hypothetical protein
MHDKAILKLRSHLKRVFSSDIGAEPSSQVLDILEYVCGLILGLVLISTEIPKFEMASRNLARIYHHGIQTRVK